jgi:hypothetical protein
MSLCTPNNNIIKKEEKIFNLLTSAHKGTQRSTQILSFFFYPAHKVLFLKFFMFFIFCFFKDTLIKHHNQSITSTNRQHRGNLPGISLLKCFTLFTEQKLKWPVVQLVINTVLKGFLPTYKYYLKHVSFVAVQLCYHCDWLSYFLFIFLKNCLSNVESLWWNTRDYMTWTEFM